MAQFAHARRHGPGGPDEVLDLQKIYVGTTGVDGIDALIAANPSPFDVSPVPYENGYTADPTGTYEPVWFALAVGGDVVGGGVPVDGTAGEWVFTLPAGLRPSFRVPFASVDIEAGASAIGWVEPDGNVYIVDQTASDPVIGDGTITGSMLENSGVAAGTYGDASHAVTATVDAKGRVTAIVANAIAVAESAVTGLVSDLAGKLGLSVFTTKGDIVAATASATVARVGVGSDGQVLTADAASTAGVKWAAASGSSSPLTTKGDLYGHSTVDARVPVGSNNAVLVADSAQTLGVKWVQVGEAMIALTDVTTDNVTSSAHGFAPKSPADATKFLNGDTTPAYAQVKDSDLSTSDITTNNVSTSKHGLAPKAPNDGTKYLDGTGAYSVPPGTAGAELDYVTKSSSVTVSGTSDATANTIITGNAVTYDGSTRIKLEFSAPLAQPGAADIIVFTLHDGSTDLGELADDQNANTGTGRGWNTYLAWFLTPSAGSHTYSICAWRSSAAGTVFAGAFGSGTFAPMWMRITKA